MSRSLRQSRVLPFVALVVLLLLVVAAWAAVLMDFRQTQVSDGSTFVPLSAAASAKTSESASPEPGWTMADARRAFAREDSRTLVLGDSTGDGYDEWVHLWAQAEDLPTASWTTQSQSGFEAESPETRVWSGSMPEATAAYPAKHWEQIWPAADPDLVLLSFGHEQESPAQATKELEALRADIADRVEDAPIVVLLQNPKAEDVDADMREAIAAWALETGLPTIDIAKAFEESDMGEADLRLDSFHPSGAGSQLWADTVGEALG